MISALALAAQLEALAVDQAILAELVAGLGVEDPAINAVLAAIQARLDELAQPVDLDIGADLAQLAAQLEALVADQATLAELVAVIAAEDPAINAALAAIEARLDGLAQPVEIDIGANLVSLAAQLEALAVDQAALAEMVAGIAVEDPAINAALAAITERQAALEAVIADLAAAPAPDAGQADALAALTEQLVAIEARIDELVQPVEVDIGADLAPLAGQLQTLAVDQAALAELVAVIAAEDPAINAALAAIEARLDELVQPVEIDIGADLGAASRPAGGPRRRSGDHWRSWWPGSGSKTRRSMQY